MIRTLAAIVLALHGVIHLIGFVVPWRIATLQDFAYRTTAFNGALDLSDAGARVVGVVWLALTLGFLAAGYALKRGRPWAVALTAVLAVVSLLVCLVGLPETAAGVVIDLLVLVAAGYVAIVRHTHLTTRRRSADVKATNA
jgi:hypothetical protein